MTTILLRFVLALVLFSLDAQSPPAGNVTVQTTTTVSATAGTGTGTATCTFTANGTNIQSNCSGNGATLTSTFPTPVPPPGTVGTFSLSGNTITWSYTPGTGNTAWQVVANGTSKNGTF